CGHAGETYIIAGEDYVNIGRVFELVSQVLNVNVNLLAKKNPIDILFLNLRKKLYAFCKKADLITYFMAGNGKRIHRAYSIQKANKELNYFPQTSLEAGISKTIKWAKENGLLVNSHTTLSHVAGTAQVGRSGKVWG
ncbi:MAG: hypothetical protein QME68_07110, partial [Elusimicrobiota bacterium]|nr:hypothetical protein [Elusimicrobiota bacterium]